MRRTVASFVALVVAAPLAAQARAPDVAALSWLAGCWRLERDGRVVDEMWSVPRGGILLGSGRTFRGDSLRGYEQTRIAVVDGRLAFTARPSGEPETTFLATSVTAGEVVFENPAHDFPRLVAYRRAGPDSLVARIVGPADGGTRTITFPYARISCDPPR